MFITISRLPIISFLTSVVACGTGLEHFVCIYPIVLQPANELLIGHRIHAGVISHNLATENWFWGQRIYLAVNFNINKDQLHIHYIWGNNNNHAITKLSQRSWCSRNIISITLYFTCWNDDIILMLNSFAIPLYSHAFQWKPCWPVLNK